MLLATACNKNEIANEENTEKKGFSFPVTVNVTREGDDPTKATFNDGTKKLGFSAGDKLFVSGIVGGYDYEFAGTLDYVPATEKFSGTIYTSKEWTGTADALFTAAIENPGNIFATLLPAGYESYGYLYIQTDDEYNDEAAQNNTYTLATSKAAGVEQFSYEKATTYSSGFALAPQNAILNFTITGLTASTNVAVALTGSGYTITKTVTTDASGNATFAAGVSGGKDLNNFSLTVAGNAITLVSSSKELVAGKIYNITRSAIPYTPLSEATSADNGRVVCVAGHLHNAKTAVPAGCIAVGILGKVTSTGHGLILALRDATSQNWNTINGWASVESYASTTLKLLPDNAARGSLPSYTKLGSTTVSNWCVAQKSDYEAIFTNLGSTKIYDYSTTYDDHVNAFITTGVGGSALIMSEDSSLRYWSATAFDGGNAWYFRSAWWDKGGKSLSSFIRPVLAF